MTNINDFARCCIHGAMAVAAFAANPVIAHANDSALSMKIEVGEINPATPRGMEQIHRRVLTAARKICDFRPDIRDLQELANQRTCVDHAVASAQPQIAALIGAKSQATNVAIAGSVLDLPGSNSR